MEVGAARSRIRRPRKPDLLQHIKQRTSTQTHKHTNAQTHKHTNAQTHNHTSTQTRTQTHRHTNTQTHKHTSAQTHANTRTQTNTQEHKHTSTQTHKHTDTHAHRQPPPFLPHCAILQLQQESPVYLWGNFYPSHAEHPSRRTHTHTLHPHTSLTSWPGRGAVLRHDWDAWPPFNVDVRDGSQF